MRIITFDIQIINWGLVFLIVELLGLKVVVMLSVTFSEEMWKER